MVTPSPSRQSFVDASDSALRTPPEPTRIHPALRSFGDECGDAFVKVLAYVGVLAILAAAAILAATHYTTLFEAAAVEPAPRPDFVPTPRSPPAFAVSQLDFAGKTDTYQVLRHREGGRKDVLRWAAPGEPVATELEIYRPGAEAGQACRRLPISPPGWIPTAPATSSPPASSTANSAP